MMDWFIGIFIILASTGLVHEFLTGANEVHPIGLLVPALMLLLLLWAWFHDKFIKDEDDGWGGGP